MARLTKATGEESVPARGASAERGNLGIITGGDALRSAALLGVALVLAATVLAAAYLAVLRAPGSRAALIQTVSAGHATQRAQVLSRAVADLRERLQAAARAAQASSPAGGAALPADGFDDFGAALQGYFPGVRSLRVISLSELGTAEFDAGLRGLRNHIEVDLVRRASNGEVAQPEAYEVEGRWLASLAQMAANGATPDRRAVVLVTLDEDGLGALLAGDGDLPGRFTLRQRVYSGNLDRAIDILSRGNGVAGLSARAPVANTRWEVIFSPSPSLVEELYDAARPDYVVLLLVALVAVAGVTLTSLRGKAALAEAVTRIGGSAEQRTVLELDVPELVPLARELRRTSSRQARGTPPTPSVEAHRPADAGASLSSVEGPASSSFPAHIFRAYDVRGIADSDLDDETVYRIGCAIGSIAGEMDEQVFALGYDGRVSSSRIKNIIEKALLRTGRDVVDIGLVPTPLLYFATQRSEATSGIMITGSHSPAECNGLKIVLAGRTVAEGAIETIRDRARSGRFSKGRGHMIQRSVVSEYIDEIVSDIAIAVPLRIVVDAGNGATGHIAPALLEELGCEVFPLNCEVDGSFPNRSPDSSDDGALEGLVAEVLARDADFGVAYDGDGDRLAIVTGRGRILRTDTLMMVFARDIVIRHPGADVVYDVKCSRNLAQLITSFGGRPVLSKTGHALMKQKMAETGALLGGEFSGHIFFGERWYGFDDGMYATGRLAEILSSQELSLDEFIADLPVAVSTPEILVPVPDDEKFALIDRFVAEAQFSDGRRNDLDGLRVDFHDGWGLLRASNTGPALTARFEASTEQALDRIRGEFRQQLGRVAPDLQIPF